MYKEARGIPSRMVRPLQIVTRFKECTERDLPPVSLVVHARPPGIKEDINFLNAKEEILYPYMAKLMDFSIPVNWMSPFPNLGVSGAFLFFIILILFLIEFPVNKQWRP